MPLFTTKPVDQLFERFMKHHVSPAGSGAVCQWQTSSTDRNGSVDRCWCPQGTSTLTLNQMLLKPTASKQSWTQKRNRKEEPP